MRQFCSRPPTSIQKADAARRAVRAALGIVPTACVAIATPMSVIAEDAPKRSAIYQCITLETRAAFETNGGKLIEVRAEIEEEIADEKVSNDSGELSRFQAGAGLCVLRPLYDGRQRPRHHQEN